MINLRVKLTTVSAEAATLGDTYPNLHLNEILCVGLQEVLEDSNNRLALQQLDGVALMAYLLQQRSPTHLTRRLLVAVQELLKASTVGSACCLTEHVLKHLIVNFHLWSAASYAEQEHHMRTLRDIARSAHPAQ